jgi:uncharacterized damage-inducible protein DinB
MPIKDALLSEFDHEMATTRRLLERLPDDKFAWKPHDKSMSLGGLATHLTNLPFWGITILTENSYDLAAGPPHATVKESRSEILTAFDDAIRRTRGLLDKTDAEYLGMWSLKRSGQEMFSLPRVSAFRSFVMNHVIHHRGQLSVYLRLNDVAVPPIYGPTADEG